MIVNRGPGCEWCWNPLHYQQEHPICFAHVMEYKAELEGERKRSKALVEALKYIHDNFPNGPLVDAIIEESLAKYREAV